MNEINECPFCGGNSLVKERGGWVTKSSFHKDAYLCPECTEKIIKSLEIKPQQEELEDDDEMD